MAALYVVEPGIHDIVVEGRSDAAAIRWYMRQHGIKCKVYAVDDRVEVPSSAVRSFDLDVNARGRVIALARNIAERAPSASLTCVIDADFDYLGNETPDYSCSTLLVTDFAALEGYALDVDTLEKFLRLVLSLSDSVSASVLLSTILPPLSEIFLVRASIKSVVPDRPLVEKFERCLKKGEGIVSVDVSELIRRSVGGKEEVTAVEVKYAELRSQLPSDLRKAARGHDIIRLISFVVGESRDCDLLERALMGCLERAVLDPYPLFTTLRERAAS
ncbi:DUF4435 domain-containing protein [Lentzea sp. BCCO 10_0856]|uniref:DUF4435 domain-containing protein n=1 Tax=Lentzea miocenica TaxID=3095431 RepID=A0ABU4T8Z3_9PSEU|nr:DUF4435 domain-containing protein [Lentzea sp. BCCO 10_0856]MDX8034633.1 DUF4435 domain-containing protein [Lentzea sp. BCCO 10_0856]